MSKSMGFLIPELEDDPNPFITETFERFGAFVRDDDGVPTVKALSAALGACTSVVNALSDSKQSFNVRFSPTEATGSTRAGAKVREVVIGVMPMLDPRLTDGQRATVMVGLAFHECGHVRWSMDWGKRIEKEWGHTPHLHKWARQVYNLASDVNLEVLQGIDYPGFAGTLGPKTMYFATQWEVIDLTTNDRYLTGLQRTRYPWGTDWDEHGEEVFFWDDWSSRLQDRKALKPKTMLALIQEALDHIAPVPEDEEPSDEGDESEEGEDGEEGEGEGESKESEDEDESGSAPESEKSEPGEGAPSDDKDEDDDFDWAEDAEMPDPEDEALPEPESDGEGDKPSLHQEPTKQDVEWQADIDDFNAAQVKGRDLVLTGGGAFQKREVRIKRIK